MYDEIEQWVVEHYGEITQESVEFGPFWPHGIVAVVVRTWNGVTIGMGINYQLAVHDLYLRLTTEPKLKTALSGWWQERFEASKANEFDNEPFLAKPCLCDGPKREVDGMVFCARCNSLIESGSRD